MLHMQDLAGPAKIELGKLLAMARAGRQPDSDVTVWPDCSTSTYQLPDGTCPPARATSDTSGRPPAETLASLPDYAGT
jgi:hypothetical protein